MCKKYYSDQKYNDFDNILILILIFFLKLSNKLLPV